MRALEPGLPSFGVVAAALRLTTDRLALEIMAPTHTAPGWSSFEWSMARAAITMQGCAGLLAGRPQWPGQPEWRGFLVEQRAQIAAIQDHARELLTRIDEGMRTAGVACVALKGSALLALGLLSKGERSMGDVDLLVRPTDVEATGAVLKSLGYRTGHWSRRHTVYYPPASDRPVVIGEHCDNPLRIEVHPCVSEELPLSPIDITEWIWPQVPSRGINSYSCLAALMAHNLLHAAGNMRARVLRLIQLHDIATLARRLTASDWQELVARQGAEGCWWMYPPLAFTERYLPGAIPAAVLDAAHDACPRWLRWRTGRHGLYDLSWSNLRIEALPGVEWARSPLEVVRFARSRVFPSKVALQEIADGASRQPGLMSVEWYQLSHMRRISRWVKSRPPRVHTLLQVRAAAGLNQPYLNDLP